MSIQKKHIKEKILVVEDTSYLRDDLVEFLRLEGFEAFGAPDGQAALDFLHNSNELPDLILSDIMMPRLDGLGFLKVAKQEPAFVHIPLIFLTARSEFTDIWKSLQLGALDYITKPFYTDELLNSIDKWLNFTQDKQQISDDRSTILIASSLQNIKIAFWIKDSKLRSEALSYARLFSKHTYIDASPIVGNEFRYGIAKDFPTAIMVYEPTEAQITVLREFCLSSAIPIIGIFSKRISIHSMQEFYNLGIDEICVKSDETEIDALARAIQQYSYPSLVEIGEAWNVVIVCGNDDLAREIQQNLTNSFYTTVTTTRSIETVINNSQSVDLILMDEANTEDVLSNIRHIRENGIEAPILLLVTEITEEANRAQYELGIRGFLSKPIIKEHLITQIKRLLRWGRQIRSLTEYWSDYRIMAAEAEFKHTLATTNPALASHFVEIGARYSGLIHDLRNALGLLEGRLQRVNDDPQLKAAVHFANQLLEIIAEARFKGAWRVSEYEAENVAAIIMSAVENARLARPNCSISLEMSDTLPAIIADARQLEEALTALLLAIAKSCDHLDVSVVPDKKSLSIQISGSDALSSLPTRLEQAVQSEESLDLYLLSAIKLFNRHRATITFDDATFLIDIPTGGWAEDLAVRLDIAHFADKVDDINKKLEELLPLPHSDSIAPLVNEPITELMIWCDKIVALSQSHGERLIKTARYASLLVRDMLYTSVGYSLPLHSVNLRTIIDTFIDLRGDRLGSIKLSIDIDDMPLVKAEELGLLQIMVNLTTNAIEAMGGRGELTIRAKRNGDYVRLEVQDTGSGIPQTELPKLFDLFYSTKQGHERGVGLHIVKSLVDQFNGEIIINSTEGEGTIFSVNLPVAYSN